MVKNLFGANKKPPLRYSFIVTDQIRRLVRNVLKYKNFSFNMNSRTYWNDRLSKYDNFWRDKDYHHLIEFLPNTNFSLLDVGCALGDGCEYLAKEFPNALITGIDLSEVGIEKAKRFLLKNRFLQEAKYRLIFLLMKG